MKLKIKEIRKGLQTEFIGGLVEKISLLIENVFNPDKVIRDIYRVLKNGGVALITTRT
jgi:SAM-dependent methyltransferase